MKQIKRKLKRTFVSISSSRSTLISLPFSSLCAFSTSCVGTVALFVARSPAIRLFCFCKKKTDYFSNAILDQIILTARIFFKQPCNQVLMVCLATSSSIMYSNSSRARSSSNWSAFLMSTERYDNILKKFFNLEKNIDNTIQIL